MHWLDPNTLKIVITLTLLAVAIVTFATELIAPDVVAVGMMVLLVVTGVLTADQAFSVVSNDAPITVAAMFVIGVGMQRAGVLESVSRRLKGLPPWTEGATLTIIVMVAAVLSAWINYTPVVVMFLPVVMALARHLGQRESKLLIPLSYGAIFGGSCTLIGSSTNLVVSGVIDHHGQRPLGMFELVPAGVLLALIGVVYLVFIGRRLLPDRESLSSLLPTGAAREYLTELVVLSDSPLVGKRLAETGLKRLASVHVFKVSRGSQELYPPLEEVVLQSGDKLLISSVPREIAQVQEVAAVSMLPEKQFGLEHLRTSATLMIEGLVSRNSHLIGRTIREFNTGSAAELVVLAVHRRGRNITSDLHEQPLEFGDTVLVLGTPQAIAHMRDDRDLIVISDMPVEPLRRRKAAVTIGILAGVVLLATFNILPISVLAVGGATLMVLFGCLDAREAYRAIEWPVIMLIVGTLSLGVAMDVSGAAKLIAHAVTGWAGGLGPVALVSAMYFVSLLLSELLSTTAVAALMSPIALAVAEGAGLNARPFIVAVAFGSSLAFAIPTGYQTHMLVYGPGGYKFRDFLKVGLPLDLLMWFAASLIIPWLYPLR